MFTQHQHLGIRNSEVMWKMDASGPSATPSYDPLKDDLLKNVKDRLTDLKNLGTDQAIQYRMLQSIQSDLRKVSNQNQAQKVALDKELERALDSSTGLDQDSQKKIQALKEEFARDFKKVEADKITPSPIQIGSAAPLSAPAVTQNGATRPESVKSALGYTSVVGQKAQAKALGELLGVDTKNSVISDLEDANIPSLLSVLKSKSADDLNAYVSKYNEGGIGSEGWDIYNGLRDLGYSSNGTLGSTEAGAVKNFIEYFLSAPQTIKSKISTASDFAQVGLATTVARNSIAETVKLKDMDSVITYLSNIPDARFKASDVATVLRSLKDTPNFSSRLAVLCGMESGPIGVSELAAGLMNSPERKARFFENINTAGANQNVSLRNFLLGKGSEKATETANDINKAISGKAVQAVLEAQAQSASTSNPTEKEKIDAVLAEYNKKGEGWLTGEIRKVAEGAFANIGKNANTLGVGMSFETFVRGLTVNLGAGISNGKIGPAAVVHYDVASGKLTETEKKIIEGGIGVGTSVFPAVIPFINGSLKATDKLQVYGKGIGGVDSTGLSAMISKSGGVLSLNFMNERKSEIDQGVAKLNSVIADFSTLKMSDITKEKITAIISVKDKMSITPEEATYWVSRMKELYRVNGVTDTTPSEAKAILIKGLVESEGEKKYTQEAMNDTDARSYKGFSVGIGHLFGVTFPLAGLIFKEGKIEYSYPDIKSQGTAKSVEGTRVLKRAGTKEETTTQNVNQPKATSLDSLRSRTEINNMLADGIYRMSRRKAQFPHFDSALVKASNGDYSGALGELKKMPNSEVAKKLIEFAGDTPEKLSIMNTFTYGGYGKNKEKFNKSDYAKARSDTIKAENRLAPGNPAAEVFFQSKEQHSAVSLKERYQGQDISTSVFATPLGGTHRIDKYAGSVTVSDAVYEGEMTEAQKTRLLKEHSATVAKNLKLLNEFITSLGGKISVSDKQYEEILKTGKVPAALGGLALADAPRFIEGRAMINGNICANRVEAIIFPVFKYPKITTIPEQPPVFETVTNKEPDVGGAGFIATEVLSGLAGSLYAEKPKPAPTPGTTTPGVTPGTPNPEPENPPPGPGGGGGGGGNTGGGAGGTGGERPPDNPRPITTPGHTTTPNQTVNTPPVTTVTPGGTNVTVEIGAPITPLPAPAGNGNATGTSGGR